jgi:hypothetical protein
LEQGWGIAGGQEEVYVCGEFMGEVIFGSGETEETHLYSAGKRELFLASYGDDGELNWAERAGGEEWDICMSLDVTEPGSILASGFFGGNAGGSAAFDEGEDTEATVESNGAADIFIAKYEQDGKLEWVNQAGGGNPTKMDMANRILNIDEEELAIAGTFADSAIFSPGEAEQISVTGSGSEDAFLAKYDSGGLVEWAVGIGGVGTDWAFGAESLMDKSLLVVGTFENSAVLGSVDGETQNLVSNGECDSFVALYDGAGGIEWSWGMGGAGADYGYDAVSVGDNAIVVIGQCDGTAYFSNDESDPESVCQGNEMVFIARYEW